MTEKKELTNLTKEELVAEIAGLGEKSFRAKQLWQWIYFRGVTDFAEMSNLSLSLRQKLEENYTAYDLDLIETNPVRCPDPEKAKEMEELIFKIKGEGDTIGGVVTCVVKGCPIGLGQPIYGKLQSALAAGMLSINAAKAFEYGDGFKGLKMKGSEQNDVFYNNNGRIETRTNHSGGIQGGISNGQDIYFRVAFKPVATVLMEQHTVNMDGIDTTLKARGRHDPCVLPRAVPIVEAMTAMTLLDYYLLDRTTQL